MTPEQKQTLAAALRAETDPVAADHVANRRDVQIAEWCNAASSVNAWKSSMPARDLFEATDVTKFDNLTAGKRESWSRLERFAPIDFSRNKMRAAVKDVWGVTDAPVVMANCTRTATNAEAYLGGKSATESGVTALKLNWTGTLSHPEISDILNNYKG